MGAYDFLGDFIESVIFFIVGVIFVASILVFLVSGGAAFGLTKSKGKNNANGRKIKLKTKGSQDEKLAMMRQSM